MPTTACFSKMIRCVLLTSLAGLGAVEAAPTVGLTIDAFVDVNGTVSSFQRNVQPGPTLATNLTDEGMGFRS